MVTDWRERRKKKSIWTWSERGNKLWKIYVPFCLWISTWIMLQQAIHWRTGAKGKHCKGGYLFTTIRCGGYNHTAKMPTKGHNTSVQSQVPEETFGCRHKQSLSASEKKRKLKAKLTVSNLAPGLLRPILLRWHSLVCVKRSYSKACYVLLIFLLFFSDKQQKDW